MDERDFYCTRKVSKQAVYYGTFRVQWCRPVSFQDFLARRAFEFLHHKIAIHGSPLASAIESCHREHDADPVRAPLGHVSRPMWCIIDDNFDRNIRPIMIGRRKKRRLGYAATRSTADRLVLRQIVDQLIWRHAHVEFAMSCLR